MSVKVIYYSAELSDGTEVCQLLNFDKKKEVDLISNLL